MAIIAWVAFNVAVVDFFVRPSLDVLWAFLLCSSVITVPRWVHEQIEVRRDVRRGRKAQ